MFIKNLKNSCPFDTQDYIDDRIEEYARDSDDLASGNFDSLQVLKS